MSDDRPARDAEDKPLPDELAQCQSHLAAWRLPPSRVDRDELLYQAGWAAAEAHAIRQDRSRHANSNARVTVAWSLASSLVAASLATFIMLWLSSKQREIVVDGTAPTQQGNAAVVRVEATPRDQPEPKTRPRPAPARREFLNASLLNMRELALHGEWDEIRRTMHSTEGDAPAESTSSPRPTTARELLREFVSPPT